MTNDVSQRDMELNNRMFRFRTPAELPLSFCYGGRVIHGLPAEFSPVVERRKPDANIMEYIIRGRDDTGLEIRVEYQEYLDYPVTEFAAFFTNGGSSDTSVLSNIKIIDAAVEEKQKEIMSV